MEYQYIKIVLKGKNAGIPYAANDNKFEQKITNVIHYELYFNVDAIFHGCSAVRRLVSSLCGLPVTVLSAIKVLH